MDLHVPHGPIGSLKDFLLHIGIVTIGILIALGLEQVVEAFHRHHLAQEAVAGFRHEVTENRKQIQEVIAGMPELRKGIDAEIGRLSAAAPTDGKPRAAITYPGINMNPLMHASWDTAIATQALGELPYETVNRYAQTYESFRLFAEEEQAGLTQWQDLHRFGDDPAKLTAEQTQALVERLRAYRHLTGVVEEAGNQAIKRSDQALQGG